MRAKKKTSNQTPTPPVQGPPAPGEYRVEYMHAGKLQSTLGGKSQAQIHKDYLSGRTTDAGTRSILDGMKNFMKSSARGALKGGIRGGGGGRPGTRL
jgi:hypothetical protein